MSTDQAKPVVLLIDDSADVHRLVSARLKHEPIELRSAMSGSIGLSMARELNPAAILLDLDMPDPDGFAVLRTLKSDAALSSVPVLVLSGMKESTDKVTAFELGAADYVTKPFDFMELRARLRAALRIQQLIKLLAERAEIDGLTGLGNRAQFNRRWTEETAEARRYQRGLTLAVMDLDHFKKVNDTYGHPAGDEVITTFARTIQACIRTHDVACRYGGEEFTLIMPGTSPDDAKVVAERIRSSLAALSWTRHPEHKVTCSIGLSGTTDGLTELSPQQWLDVADKALYAAKHGGRNRVVTAPLTMPAPATPV